ncbi:MAG: hypothetical protein VYA34_10405 [Myxococcota bacterium]|nr:hypothetical protein [Myxococcota bacterium]
MSGDQLNCDQSQCQLQGHAEIQCDKLNLRADEIWLRFDQKQQFQDAQAFGNVVLIDKDQVLKCQQIYLGDDRIKAEIPSANLKFLKPGAHPPDGPARSIVNGDITRFSDSNFQLRDANFTFCDCEQSQSPSWRLSSPKVDIDLNSRATIWWPVFEINPFNLGLIPITPPMAPLSLPLAKRAPGLLAPLIRFYHFPYPMLGIPLFVPLGKSYDITLTPAIRFDWGSHDTYAPKDWGAPSVETKIRFHPKESIQGNFEVHWTFDSERFAAHRAVENRLPDIDTPEGLEKLHETRTNNSSIDENWQNLTTDEAQRLLWSQYAESDRAYQLRHRVAVKLGTDIDWSDSLYSLIRLNWVSDDLYPRDFAVSLYEQATHYIPSRAVLYFDSSYFTAQLGADYYLRLDSSLQPDPYKTESSNISAGEWGSDHRTPTFKLALNPLQMAKNLYVYGSALLSRIGPYTAGPYSSIYSGTLGAFWSHNLGIFNLELESSVDLMRLEHHGESLSILSPRIGASLETIARGKILELTHEIIPYLRYANIPWQNQVIPQSFALGAQATQHEFHQVIIGLQQRLFQANSFQQLLDLNLYQGFDVQTQETLSTVGQLSLTLGQWLNFQSSVTIDWRRETKIRDTQLSASIGYFNYFKFYLKYSRWALDTERFQRSAYALMGANQWEWEERWNHVLQTSFSSRIFNSISIRYGTEILLKRPYEPAPLQMPIRPYLTNHNVSLSYQSPCDCWGIGLNVIVRDPNSLPANLKYSSDEVTISLNISVGNIQLSNR